jgi:hypothetical protein
MGIRSLSTASISAGTKRSKVWDQSAVVPTNSYESIATYVVGAGGTASYTFSSIPQTYKHLQIRVVSRSDRAITAEGTWFYPNGDTTTTNYTRHVLGGDGSTTFSSATVPTSGGTGTVYTPGASALSNAFSVGIVDIFDYTNTNKYKTFKTLTGLDTNGTNGEIRVVGGLWLSTSAITSIKIDTQGGGNFTQYTTFALYGIKG